jgi:hypothetical protein
MSEINQELLIPIGFVFIGLGLMVCFKLYNDKIKSIIISHDQIQIDFKLLRARVDTLLVENEVPLLDV